MAVVQVCPPAVDVGVAVVAAADRVERIEQHRVRAPRRLALGLNGHPLTLPGAGLAELVPAAQREVSVPGQHTDERASRGRSEVLLAPLGHRRLGNGVYD